MQKEYISCVVCVCVCGLNDKFIIIVDIANEMEQVNYGQFELITNGGKNSMRMSQKLLLFEIEVIGIVGREIVHFN